MAKICPSCRYQGVEDNALFCNKCGYPFPQTQPRKPAMAAPVMAAAPARRPAQRAARQPERKKTGIGGFFSFDTLVVKKYIRLIYIIGMVMIILFSILGITGGYATKGAVPANMSFTNTSAVVQNPGSSPLFWILFLIVGSVLWRIICELCAVLSRLDDEGGGGGEPFPDEETEEYGEEVTSADGTEEPIEYVECPSCRHIVPVDHLRECEHCGVQGCSNCIRLTGLLKKKMTCRQCFEGK